MMPLAVLAELLNRLEARRGASVHIGAEELCEWPTEAVKAFKSARLLVKARPAASLTCPGCEKQCTKSVDVFPADGARPVQAYIHCDEPENMGRFEIELTALAQWRSTGEMVAGGVAHLLGITKSPVADKNGTKWTLGTLPGTQNKGEVAFSIENGGTLLLAGQTFPLIQIFTFNEGGLSIDRDVLDRFVYSAASARTNSKHFSRHAHRNAEIRAKYDELTKLGKRNYVKDIQRAVRGAESLSPRRIRDIAKDR